MSDEQTEVIQLTFDEGLEVVDQLSKLPYREVHLIMTSVVNKLAQAEQQETAIIT